MAVRANSKPEASEKAESRENLLTEAIIGAAIEVHRHLGPGLLESAYEECLCFELSRRGIAFQRQVLAPVEYKGMKLDCGYRLDLVVEDCVIVELKAAEDLHPIHSSQLLTYLKTQNKKIGLLINFNVPVLKNGIKRIVNRYAGPKPSREPSASSAPSESHYNEITETPNNSSNSASSSAPPRLRVEERPSTNRTPPTHEVPCSSAS